MNSAPTGSLLAIDAGQSSVKVRHLVDGNAADWTAPGIRTDRPLLPQLAEVLAEATRRGCTATAVGIGASGLADESQETSWLLRVAAQLGARSLSIAHDSITAFLGALGDERGAAVAVGTGVVTLAVGRTDVIRVDGWGHLLGDAGSGFWIGRAALDAVLRAHDGRGPATALAEAVYAEFPVLEDAYLQLQADPERVQRIAAYARPVAEAAARGDAVAIRISREAAGELAHSVVSGLARVGEVAPDGRATDDAGVRVCAVGGVLRSPVLAEAFTEAVRARVPAAQVRIGTADPLDGAALLPFVGASSPLRRRVVRIEDAP
ncbi:MAG: hypothetical protein JSS74_06950 [Actinobacteria bacterium]|nr:hypothetical protein [Actinomycetota bacterium]